ncbi:MAG: portal protein, partial [Pseudomonadota bacterium]
MTMPCAMVEVDRAIERARSRRQGWEQLWRDCYSFAMPLRASGFSENTIPGARQVDKIYDATAPDAVEQLAASLLANLTPPWSRWFALKASSAVDQISSQNLGPSLDIAGAVLQSHFDRSNFAVEMHQCFLDLVTIGTATLLFQEAPLGESSAFRFLAVPQHEIFLDGDSNGAITGHFRELRMTVVELQRRFPNVDLKAIRPDLVSTNEKQTTLHLMETVHQHSSGAHYRAYLPRGRNGISHDYILRDEILEQTPFITFRWLKAAGELYGRSPVMTALPDIKTANKVVELVLKNASIAVTGIWLADDDGILNPANVTLAPGSIIPKAVGSKGLTPLQAPGRFDVSDLIIEDLRTRIRHVLLTDRLGPVRSSNMTATEVLERTAEMTRLIGAIFGRLQVELINPLIRRALAIVRRRGEVPDIVLDDGVVELVHLSPLAQAQAQQDLQNTFLWLESVGRLGDQAQSIIDIDATVRWLAEKMGIPPQLVLPSIEIDPMLGSVAALLANQFANS